MWITYLLIVVVLVIAELSYFKISDKYIIVDKQKERSLYFANIL